MIYIEAESTDAAFHFSAEEYLTRRVSGGEPVIMLWQADKCVMLGQYQVADAEIDRSYAEKSNIQIVRRSSGGGTIFTDLGTILYTMILPYDGGQYAPGIARETIVTPIADALNRMGIPSVIQGRNDILTEGKKVSGFAQYARHGSLCSHGSLLYDTDLETLGRVLRVDDEKIHSKAIRSVRGRVTNLKQYMEPSCSTREFMALLKQKLLSGQSVQEYTFTESELNEINQIYREKYGNPAWTFQRSPKFSFHNSIRFDGGKVEISLDIVKGVVASCAIRGDFLGTVPIRGLEARLEQKAFMYQDLNDALDGISLHQYLGDISKEQFLSCIFEEGRPPE